MWNADLKANVSEGEWEVISISDLGTLILIMIFVGF